MPILPFTRGKNSQIVAHGLVHFLQPKSNHNLKQFLRVRPSSFTIGQTSIMPRRKKEARQKRLKSAHREVKKKLTKNWQNFFNAQFLYD